MKSCLPLFLCPDWTHRDSPWSPHTGCWDLIVNEVEPATKIKGCIVNIQTNLKTMHICPSSSWIHWIVSYELQYFILWWIYRSTLPAHKLWETGYDWLVAWCIVIQLKQRGSHQVIVIGHCKVLGGMWETSISTSAHCRVDQHNNYTPTCDHLLNYSIMVATTATSINQSIWTMLQSNITFFLQVKKEEIIVLLGFGHVCWDVGAL